MAEKFPESLHFVGIGGIGMSGLAQLARSLGWRVTGSDRALDKPENAQLFQALRAQGIELFPQDGSRFSAPDRPGGLVYSTAIEDDNPDFKAAGDLPRFHRSAALSAEVAALHCRHTIAVTGTCGKTSVSAWLAEALFHAGKDPGVLAGGLVNAFRKSDAAGNFRPSGGEYFVLEADESDKSLLNYGADSALILNIGTDHYPKEELARVFGTFLKNIRNFAVIELEAYREIIAQCKLPEQLKILLFTGETGKEENFDGPPLYRLENYRVDNGTALARISGTDREIRLPGPGRHQALNALALYAELKELGLKTEEALTALESFHGVWRRFDPAGINSKGVRFFDDYAHNVEKIISCLNAGRELSSRRLILFFQPHGFAPLGFMREELFLALENDLHDDDLFVLLPVYYAGGTSSFKPRSSEVAADWQKRGTKNYLYLDNRSDAVELVRNEAGPGDVVLIMGARDNSLSAWAEELAKQSDAGGSC